MSVIHVRRVKVTDFLHPLPSSHDTCSRPFELVYSDVWGPSPVFSLNGSCYFVLFIDDCIKFVWIYFLSHKSQVFSTFLQFCTMIKNQFSCDIKSLQTDWDGEYRNVSTFLHSNGIMHRLSCPHTHEQNGAVERRNRVIVEKGLTLLAHSSLPHLFWKHAFKTSTYLHNRTITPSLNYESPYQKLYHKISGYNFLKIFGCLCYPFLRPYKKYKIDFRSLPCIFIGYSASYKGYLCFDQSTSRIYISCHVVFDEDTFPYVPPTPVIQSVPTSPPNTSNLLAQSNHLRSSNTTTSISIPVRPNIPISP